MAQSSDAANVLLVEDDEELAELYAQHLSPRYNVVTVHTGEAALNQIDRGFDVVLLDRKLPDMSGEELVQVCRDRTHGSRIAMVTAVNPDFDIMKMEIDDYLVKPIRAEELIGTVENLLNTDALDEKKLELSSKKVKRNVLQVEKRQVELARSDEFQRLKARINGLQTQIENLEAKNA